MITKKLLLLLLLWPFFLWSQVNLVRWNEANYVPNVTNTSALNQHSISVNPSSASISSQNWGETFFMISGMQYSASLNSSNYVQLMVSPKSKYKIEADKLNFQYRSQGNTVKFQVRASKSSAFTNYFVIADETIATTNWNTFEQSLTDTGVIKPGEVLYIRIYIYGNNDNFHIKYTDGSNVSNGAGPTVTGTYTNINSTAPVAVNDSFNTTVNNSIALDVLNNDSYPSLTSIALSANPTHGTATINGTSSITYAPELDFAGTDTFTYKLTNAYGVSADATVTVLVSADTSKVLVRWEGVANNTSLTPTYYDSGVTSNNFSSSSNTILSGGYSSFYSGDWGGTGNSLNSSYYLQYDLKANVGNQVVLNKFNITPWVFSGSPQNYQVFYSKTGNFTGEQIALKNTANSTVGTIGSSQAVQSWVFPSNFILYPSEKITIRVYPYNPTNIYWSYFYLGYDNKGTSFEGLVQNVTKCANTVTWNGAWSPSAPTANSAVIIDADYSGNSFNACSVTVNSGKKIIINSNKSVNINYNLINNGIIQVESDGNLVQLNNATNSGANIGTVLVRRNTSLKKNDYNYWGAPVSGQNLKSFSPNTLNNRFYTYNEANDMFVAVDPSVNSFMPGVGYAIRAANNLTNTATTVVGEYTGIPNNGDVTVQVKKTTNGFNMIANPYPSNVDIEKFFTANSATLNKIAYFWTNLNPNPAMQGSNYPNGSAVNNYAIYNGSGGVPATGPASKTSATPTQYLKVGQGFIVQSKVAGTSNVVFKNSMRSGSTNSVFFNRSSSTKATNETTDRFWLQLTTPLDVANKILVAYKQEATDDFEIDYDAPLMVVGSDSFYSLLGNEKLAIQGRKYPMVKDDVIPLGTSFHTDGNYTISLSEREGIFENTQSVYLRDNLTGVVTNLSENDYTFTAKQGVSDSRFEIVYTNGTLTTDSNTKKDAVVYQSGGYFVLQSPSIVKKVSVYDATGKLVFQKNESVKTVQIDAQNLFAGVYIINAETQNGTISKKVLKK